MVALFGMATAAALAGCKGNEPKPSLGDPVGVRISDPSDATRELEVAFAIEVGKDPAPFVPGVARVLHEAVNACPAAVEAMKRGDVLRVTAQVAGGALRTTRDGAAAEVECVRASIDGARIVDGTQPATAMVIELESPRATAAKP